MNTILKIKSYLLYISKKTLVFMIMLVVILPALLVFMGNHNLKAVSNSLRVYGDGGNSTQCKFTLRKSTKSGGSNTMVYDGSGIIGGSSTPVSEDANKDPVFKEDLEIVRSRYRDNQQFYYIYLEPLNNDPDGVSKDICTPKTAIYPGVSSDGGGLLFVRPSNPTKLFGAIKSSPVDPHWTYIGTGSGGQGTTLAATLDPKNQSIKLSSANGQIEYRVSAAPDTPNIFSDSLFDISPQGPGSTFGFCQNLTSSAAYTSCMSPTVVDFNTIAYRGETYTLRSWSGSGPGNDFMIYYLTEAIPSRSSLVNASDSQRPSILVPVSSGNKYDYDAYDINVDGDANQSDINDVAIRLNSPPSTLTVRFNDFDLSGGRIDQRGQAIVEEGVGIELTNLSNYKKIFRYYPTDNRVEFIPNNPDDNEKRMYSDKIFIESADPTKRPLRFESPPLVEGCTSSDVVPRIDFTSDPKQASGVIRGVWSFPNYGESGTCESRMTSVNIEAIIDNTGASAPAPGIGIGGEPGNDTTAISCEDKAVDFGVITCYILRGIDSILGIVEETITELLEVNQASFTASDNAGGNTYIIWLNVARVASGLLAIIALVMVFGTALGSYRLFDAYTVKKVLPRLVFAAIGIWLSWAFLSTLIEFMNALGRGIADIMWTPFEVSSSKSFFDYGLAEVMGGGVGNGTGALSDLGIIGGIAVAGLALSAAGIGLISSLVPVLIFILIGFLVLIIRQALIIFLVVLAPVAIVAWVLPNTQFVWKKWSKLLGQLLIMFPMLMGLLAAGKIFAYITSTQSPGEKNFLELMIPVLGYITPFILLPSVFKGAGGALSKVTGALSRQGNKFGGMARKPIDERVKARKEGVKKERRLQSLQRIGTGTEKLGDRWRVGALGPGLAFGSRREALNKQQERLKAAGLAEYQKEEDGLMQEELRKFAAGGLYSEKGRLRDMAKTTNQNTYQRRAALRRLAEMGDDEGMRDLQGEYTASSTSRELQDEWTKFKSSPEFYSGFKDKAPDLVKPTSAAFDDIKSESMANWSEQTMTNAVTHLEARYSAAVASGNSEDIEAAKQSWARFGLAIHEVVSDPKLSGKMGGSTLKVISDNSPKIKSGITSSGIDPSSVSRFESSVDRVDHSGVVKP